MLRLDVLIILRLWKCPRDIISFALMICVFNTVSSIFYFMKLNDWCWRTSYLSFWGTIPPKQWSKLCNGQLGGRGGSLNLLFNFRVDSLGGGAARNQSRDWRYTSRGPFSGRAWLLSFCKCKWWLQCWRNNNSSKSREANITRGKYCASLNVHYQMRFSFEIFA